MRAMNSISFSTVLMTFLVYGDLSASECVDVKVEECIVQHMPTSQNPDKIPDPNAYLACVESAKGDCGKLVSEELPEAFLEPKRLCEKNVQDSIDHLVAIALASGDSPTQAEIDEAQRANWCDCGYKKISKSTQHLDLGSVIEDLVRIENLMRDKNLLKGNEYSELQWSWFARSLNYGETTRQVWGMAMLECQLSQE